MLLLRKRSLIDWGEERRTRGEFCNICKKFRPHSRKARRNARRARKTVAEGYYWRVANAAVGVKPKKGLGADCTPSSVSGENSFLTEKRLLL